MRIEYNTHGAADTETAGLFGSIRMVGWALDSEHYQSSPDPKVFWNAVKNLPIIIYFHNLDFDLGKLLPYIAEVENDKPDGLIDYGYHGRHPSTFIRRNRFIRVRFKGYPVVFACSFALLPRRLEEICEDFKVPVAYAKISLDDIIKAGGYRDKEDYFSRVPVDDPTYQEYLRHDVLAVHWIITELCRLSQLDPVYFYRKQTTASLSMEIFRRRFPSDYEKMVNARTVYGKKKRRVGTPLPAQIEEFVRQGLRGGRTEVYKMRFDALFSANQRARLYHYDVNSLYPSVMQREEYPIGAPLDVTEAEAQPKYWRAYQRRTRNRGPQFGIVEATVHCPPMMYPILPVVLENRVVYCHGTFRGVWVAAELAYAMSQGVEVLEWHRQVWWFEGAPVYRRFISAMIEGKLNSEGAERAFYKDMMNHSFGKTGMRRKFPHYMEDTPQTLAALQNQQRPYLRFHHPLTRQHLIVAPKEVTSEYIQPHIAAHVTAYARIVYHQQLIQAQDPYYGDTDSLVVAEPFPANIVDAKAIGAWKLERMVERALFIQPKLYAEVAEGEEILKSKGLIEDFRRTMDFGLYEAIAESMSRRADYQLYQHRPLLRPTFSQLSRGGDFTEPAYVSKKLSGTRFTKRKMDWIHNTTSAWDYDELCDALDAAQKERGSAREERAMVIEAWRKLRAIIMPIGIRPNSDFPDIPRSLRRKHGWTLDDWVSECVAAGLPVVSDNDLYAYAWTLDFHRR